MPIYRYSCSKCGNEFARLVRSSDASVTCPECGSEEVEKLFSRFSSPGAGCYPSGGG
ncbi:MAG: zinc ribbon domain-containing protein [Candidatus Latescibacteria bacterium]|nr:zinc ribbon domain-containing protein [bacterium]MBD3424183.1 zinc ribbon domain-containing protein [Candidatus Latescibacterota bacterium]